MSQLRFGVNRWNSQFSAIFSYKRTTLSWPLYNGNEGFQQRFFYFSNSITGREKSVRKKNDRLSPVSVEISVWSGEGVLRSECQATPIVTTLPEDSACRVLCPNEIRGGVAWWHQTREEFCSIACHVEEPLTCAGISPPTWCEGELLDARVGRCCCVNR